MSYHGLMQAERDRFIYLSLVAFFLLALTGAFAQKGEHASYAYKDSDFRETDKVYISRKIVLITGLWGKNI